MSEPSNANTPKAKPGYGGPPANDAAVAQTEVPSKEVEQEAPRPQLSFKSNDDEILREVVRIRYQNSKAY